MLNTAHILQIKFNSMVNYDWELRYYRGCLIAVSSKCIAYALRGTDNNNYSFQTRSSANEYMMYVVCIKTIIILLLFIYIFV